MKPWTRHLPIFAFAVALLSGQPSGVQFNTVEKELALGQQLAKDTRTQTTSVDNPEVQEYAERIGKRLCAQVKYSFSWSFEVVAGLTVNPIHEPLHLPGGFLFIPVDLVLAANDEEEFAGMLAHSIAHVTNHETTRTASFGQVINYGTIPLIFAGGWQNGSLLPKAYWTEARRFEADADLTAVRIMKKAGYNPQAFVRYLARVQPETSPELSPLLPRGSRIAALETAIQGLGASDFVKVQEQLRKQEGGTTSHKAPSLFR